MLPIGAWHIELAATRMPPLPPLPPCRRAAAQRAADLSNSRRSAHPTKGRAHCRQPQLVPPRSPQLVPPRSPHAVRRTWRKVKVRGSPSCGCVTAEA